MIIGQDKERVRLLEVEVKLSRELIEHLRNDLEEIGEAMKKEDISKATNYPYMQIFEDISQCTGHLDSFK